MVYFGVNGLEMGKITYDSQHVVEIVSKLCSLVLEKRIISFGSLVLLGFVGLLVLLILLVLLVLLVFLFLLGLICSYLLLH